MLEFNLDMQNLNFKQYFIQLMIVYSYANCDF